MYKDKMFRSYLANELSMTERGIKLMIESNPKRYKQLLVGSLVLKEISIESFIEKIYSENEKLFLSDKDKNSIELANRIGEMLEKGAQKETLYHGWKQRVIKFLNSACANLKDKDKNYLVAHESSIDNHKSDVAILKDDFSIVVSISSITDHIDYEKSVVLNIKDKTLDEIYQSVKREFSSFKVS